MVVASGGPGHPMVIAGGILQENPFSVPASALARPERRLETAFTP
jgi:hypothetical protein